MTLRKHRVKPSKLRTNEATKQQNTEKDIGEEQTGQDVTYKSAIPNGVRERPSGNWEVSLSYHRKQRNIGTYTTLDDAGQAHKIAHGMLITERGVHLSVEQIGTDIQSARDAVKASGITGTTCKDKPADIDFSSIGVYQTVAGTWVSRLHRLTASFLCWFLNQCEISLSPVAVVAAGLAGLNPPGFVAEVVALAFGLAASSFFPAIILGIFDKKMNKEGAIAGMLTGIIFTALYILYFKPQLGGIGLPEDYLFGISPEGIGTIGMIINFIVSLIVSRLTKPTPEKIKALVESIRYPK